MIGELLGGRNAAIVDLGASDGVTSLELIEELGGKFSRFYVTDRRLHLRYERHEGSVRFLEPDGECVCAAGKWIVVYPPAVERGALDRLARWLAISRYRGRPFESGEISLLQPELIQMSLKDPRIVLVEHDVFEAWPRSPVDVVRIGNVLNRVYFPDAKIARALEQLFLMLDREGFLVVSENRVDDVEQATVFQKCGDGFRPIHDINRGTDIRDLVLGIRVENAGT